MDITTTVHDHQTMLENQKNKVNKKRVLDFPMAIGGGTCTLHGARIMAGAKKDDLGKIRFYPISLPINIGNPDKDTIRRFLMSHSLLIAEHEGGSRAAGSQFIGSHWLWADFDDGKTSIDVFVKKMADYNYILYTSTNHKKEKNGLVCERYKVLFPLDQPIKDPDQLIEKLKKIAAKLNSDPSVCDSRRIFFPPIDPIDNEVIINLGLDKRYITYWLADPVKKDRGIPQGERHNTLLTEVKKCIADGVEENEIRARVKEIRSHMTKDVSDKEAEDLIVWALGKIEKNKQLFTALNDRYCMILHPAGVYDRKAGKMITYQAFRQHLRDRSDMKQTTDGGKKIKIIDQWQSKSTQHVDSLVFRPDWEPGGIIRDEKASYYNSWQGKVMGNDGGDCTLYKQLLFEVICNNENGTYRWLWNYLSHVYQHPEDQIHRYAIVLSGAQGVGKSQAIYHFADLFYDTNRVVISDISLIDSFDGILAGKIIVTLEEAVGVKWNRISQKLKSLIKDREIVINEKFIPQYTLKNYLHFFVATNEFFSAPVERGDRRYVCLTPQKKLGEEFFVRLNQQQKEGGRERLAYELSTHKIDYNLLLERAIPETEGRRANKLHHALKGYPWLGAIEEWAEDPTAHNSVYIDSNNTPDGRHPIYTDIDGEGCIRRDKLQYHISGWCEKNNIRKIPTMHEIKRCLEEYGIPTIRIQRDGERARFFKFINPKYVIDQIKSK